MIDTLQDLTEPAYVLLGSVLPQDDPDSVEVLVSPTAIVRFDAEARPMLEYFSKIRTRSEALADIRQWEGTPEDLDRMVAERLLVLLPSTDQSKLVDAIEELAVTVTAPARIAPDGRSVLLLVSDQRVIALDLLTASVLGASERHSLHVGVDAVANETGMATERLWRLVLYDLTAILETGAGYLGRPEDAT